MSSHPDQRPPIPISITICGDGGCGKSSITLRLVRSQWTSDYDPTIEDSYSVTRRIDGTTYHLSLTDTAGQEEYRGMWASSNTRADAFLMVYDITSRESLDALQYFNDLVDMEAEIRLDDAERARRGIHKPTTTTTNPPGSAMNSTARRHGAGAGAAAAAAAPVKIVAGNKCDLQQSRQVPAAMGLDWARKRGCGFMETSARLEVNVEETFALVVRRVVESRRLAEMGVLDNTEMNARGMTRPLTPLGAGGGNEKGAVGLRRSSFEGGEAAPRGSGGGRDGRGERFWTWLRCWSH